MRRLFAIGVAAAAVVGVAVGVLLHSSFSAGRAQAQPLAVPKLQGQATWKAGRVAAPTFVLNDQRGQEISLRSYRGKTVVLLFMDSLCRNVCPVEGKEVALAVKQLAPRARPAILIVSVNMADTRATIADAAAHWNLPKGYEWLRGTRAQLQRVWSAYHIAVMATKNGGVVHSDAFYVIDRNGDERAGFLSPFIPGLLTGDLRYLATRASPTHT